MSTPGTFRADDVLDFAVARDQLKFFDKATGQRTQPRELDWS
jgi:hypothetical protein